MTYTNQLHPAADTKMIPIPDHLLIPVVESAFKVIKRMEETDVPTSLKRISNFDSRSLSSSSARAQIISSIESNPTFLEAVSEEFFSRAEVAGAYKEWTHLRASELIEQASLRNDLALLASIIWLKRPEFYEYALGMIVAFSKISMHKNEIADSQRAQETQFNHTQKALTREKERVELLAADVKRLEEQLRTERHSQRSLEQKHKAQVDALQKKIDQNESLVERAKDSRDRFQHRIASEASRATELESRLRVAQEEATKKSKKIEQLQEQLASALSSDVQLSYEDLQKLVQAQTNAQEIANELLKIMNRTRRIVSKPSE